MLLKISLALLSALLPLIVCGEMQQMKMKIMSSIIRFYPVSSIMAMLKEQLTLILLKTEYIWTISYHILDTLYRSKMLSPISL